MSRIRGKHTTPEKVVRSVLYHLGCQVRLRLRLAVTLSPYLCPPGLPTAFLA